MALKSICTLLILIHCVCELDTLILDWLGGEDRPVQEGDVRLVGGQVPSEGRVEVYHAGTWGTVCDDGWGMEEAQVVCSQLGYRRALFARVEGSFGQGSGQIWLDNLNCRGSEGVLAGCGFKGWGMTDCSHKEDAGVVCEAGPNSAVTSMSTHAIGLPEQLGKLFDTEKDCDFTFSIVSPQKTRGQVEENQVPGKQETICAHRVILSLIPDFNLTDSHTLEVSHSCRPHVRDFIRYLYTRSVKVTPSSAQCLHQLASKFDLVELMEDVGRLFIYLLPADRSFRTQVSLYNYAELTGDRVLRENVLEFLSWNVANVIQSAQWEKLPEGLMFALLQRSDLVVNDELSLLKAVGTWNAARHTEQEKLIALLKLIRFPMMTPEQLYDLHVVSDLFQNSQDVLLAGELLGFRFHTLEFSLLTRDMRNDSEVFQPRIYTSDLWSSIINSTSPSRPDQYNPYQNYNSKSFETPDHFSRIRQTQRYGSWNSRVFLTKQECINAGRRCETVPAAQLLLNTYQPGRSYSNRLVLACNDGFVIHVQEFKDYVALVPSNSSQTLSDLCSGDLSYRFVVRPI